MKLEALGIKALNTKTLAFLGLRFINSIYALIKACTLEEKQELQS